MVGIRTQILYLENVGSEIDRARIDKNTNDEDEKLTKKRKVSRLCNFVGCDGMKIEEMLQTTVICRGRRNGPREVILSKPFSEMTVGC